VPGQPPITLPSTPDISKAGESSGAQSAADPSSRTEGASAGVNIEVTRPTTQTLNGFMSVSVPKGTTTDGIGFRVPLSDDAVSEFQLGSDASTSATPVDVRAMIDGKSIPLPGWLRYLPEQRTLVALAIPDGGLPITIEITVGRKRTVMVISERPN
jgi:hypothetical protein